MRFPEQRKNNSRGMHLFGVQVKKKNCLCWNDREESFYAREVAEREQMTKVAKTSILTLGILRQDVMSKKKKAFRPFSMDQTSCSL